MKLKAVGTVNISQPVLATGSELKNTFCLTKGGKAYVSQCFGDLNNKETLDLYKKTINKYEQLLKVKPKIIAHDLHPNYLSTIFASQLSASSANIRTVTVQHHQAHIASVLSEKSINKPVIGFAFDGTGYGLDGNLWGSECFIFSKKAFKRAAHFEYFELPGGDIAAKEIWRLAVSILGRSGIKELPEQIKSKYPYREIRSMIEKKINSPLSCSVGRLFDAVSSIIGLRHEVSFEAQAAIELESLSVDIPIRKGYNFKIRKQLDLNDPLIISLSEMVKQIWNDKKSGVKPSVIGAKFHLTLAEIILELSKRFRKEYKINDIVLSGGVFQNKLLISLAQKKLKLNGFKVHTNQLVPSNDSGISLGQAWLAARNKTCA